MCVCVFFFTNSGGDRNEDARKLITYKYSLIVCISLAGRWASTGDVWSSHLARVWINRVRLPILLVVSGTGKISISLSPFAPKNLVSRDGFGSPVSRQPAHLHTQAESGSYLRDSSRVPRRRPFIYFRLPISPTATSLRIFPSFPGSPLRQMLFFYRDASSALLNLVNQWFNFDLRYGSQNKINKNVAGRESNSRLLR